MTPGDVFRIGSVLWGTGAACALAALLAPGRHSTFLTAGIVVVAAGTLVWLLVLALRVAA
jgi:hypothetical protein